MKVLRINTILMVLWIFTLTACDIHDDCHQEWETYCAGECSFEVITKDPIPGMPTTETSAPDGYYGYTENLTISLDKKIRKDLLQSCEDKNVYISDRCSNFYAEVYTADGTISRTHTTATDNISGGIYIYYMDVTLFGSVGSYGIINAKKSVHAYLLKEGFITLIQDDDKGREDKFILTYTPNPEYEDFLKEHDLYSPCIRPVFALYSHRGRLQMQDEKAFDMQV